MCGATVGGPSTEGVDVDTQSVIQGSVTKAGAPVSGAYVRLLDSGGEFTAEVVTSSAGAFRFFAAPGEWTLRALSAHGSAQSEVSAQAGTPAKVELVLSS